MMISSRSARQRRYIVATASLFAILAAGLLALTLTRSSQAGDGQSRYGDRYSVLMSDASPGVQVVDPRSSNDASERAKVRNATAVNPVVFAAGPIDTNHIRRANANHASRGVDGGSNVRGTWVAPSTNGGICFLVTVGDDKGAGGTCSRAGDVTNGSISVLYGHGNGELAQGETVIAGAVPDGVTSIQIDLVDGTTTTVPVADNAFTFDSGVGIARYRFVTDDGPGASIPVLGDPDA
jgi:hypothetical protein